MGNQIFIKDTLILFFLLLSLLVTGQTVSFYASTDAPILDARSRTYQITTNSQFQVSFTLENVRGSSFTPPNFGGLSVLSGPSTSSQVSIYNGARTEKNSYVYTLVGAKVGTYNIGKASIKTSRGVIETKPFTVKVMQGKAENGSGKDTYVELEVSDSAAYIGQQIVLKLKLFTQENVKSYDALTDFNFDGFYVRELNEISRRGERIIKDGQEYYTTTLKAVALFPQQTGTYEIPSFAVKVGIAKPSRRRSIFSFQEYDYKVYNTAPLKIEVEDVPYGAPVSFSGGVGKYTAVFRIDKRNISTDDNFTLTMEVRGDGDGKKLLTPELDLGSDFEVYEPNLLRDEEYVDRNKVVNYKNYEFLIVPKKSGNYELNPVFSFFDPDLEEYVTKEKSPPFKVRVVNGSGNTTDVSAVINRNISDHLPVNTVTNSRNGFMGSLTHHGILAVCSGIGLFLFFRRRQLDKIAGMDQSILRSKGANKVAIQRLGLAKTFLDKSEEKSFYDEITKTLNTYIEDKLRISIGSLTKDKLPSFLQSKGVGQSISDELINVLNISEVALFAGGKTGQMEDIYDRAYKIIAGIEEK